MAKKPNGPWLPSNYNLTVAAAIQAWSRGEATPEQQIATAKYVVEVLCRTYDLSFRPESDRETAFAEGMRWVGLQIVKLTKINLQLLKDK